MGGGEEETLDISSRKKKHMLKVKDIRGKAYLGKLNPTKLQHSVHVGPSGT